MLFIIGWYPCAVRNLSALRSLQKQNKVILDSVDIHWMRNARSVALGLNDSSAERLRVEKVDELQIYKSVDEVWVVSEVDRTELLNEIPNCPTRVIPVPLPQKALQNAKLLNDSFVEVLFVGGFHHPPNKSAAIWAAEICELARAKFNLMIVLHIIGSDPPPEVLDLDDGMQVIVHGFVEDLQPFYERASLSLVPLKFGAGVKGKLIEALSFGVPVVSTSIGTEGLHLSNSLEKFSGETTEELAECIHWAVMNKDLATQVAKDAYSELESSIGIHSVRNSLQNAARYPSVTIAIVTYNRIELLKKCLESLLSLTVHPNFRVAVWSNGCTDGTVEYLKTLRSEHSKKIDIHLHTQNDFFIKPNNEIISIYDTDDIVLINNDIEFIDGGWLAALADAAYTSSKTACAGGLTLDANGAVLEAGARILPNGFGINEFRGTADDNPEVMKFRDVGYVSGCFLYLRRDAIKSVGLLDELYYPMYFEDCDWQYRAHKMGLKTIYTPFARAIHREGSSAGTDESKGLKKFQEINRAKFIERFSSVIKDLQY